MKSKPKTLISGKRDDTDQLLTIAQVADKCRCSERAVKKWIDDGRLAYVKLGDTEKYETLIRVRESALIKFWRNSERQAI